MSEIDTETLVNASLPRAFSLQEVAKIFGRSSRTIRWWVKTGRLNAFPIGHSKYVAEAEIQRLMWGGERHGNAHKIQL